MSLLELCLLPDKVTVLTYYLLTMNARLYLCCVDIVFMVCSWCSEGGLEAIAQLWGIVGWGPVIKYVSRMMGEN